MVPRSLLFGNPTTHHRSSIRQHGSRRSVPAVFSANLMPPSLIQPLPGGGIEVILPWRTSHDPDETVSAGCSTASASATHHGQKQGATPPQMQGPNEAQSWTHSTAVRFPAMGSGLLWARSTGLKVGLFNNQSSEIVLVANSVSLNCSTFRTKVWPGALVLSRIMALHMGVVVDAVVEARRYRGHDPDSTTGSGSTDFESRVGSSSDLGPRQRLDLKQKERESYSPALSRGAHSGHTWWESWEDVVVVELGCGLALCSIIASKLGARVLGTDGDPDLVWIAKNNIAENTRVSRERDAGLGGERDAGLSSSLRGKFGDGL